MQLTILGGAFDFLKPLGTLIGLLKIPFAYILAFIYTHLQGLPVVTQIGAYGIGIIILTLMIKSLLFPVFQTQLKLTKKSQAEMARINPELTALRKKYKGDPQRLNTEMMALYKEHGINPLSQLTGCLPILVQMPILIGLYQAIYNPGLQALNNAHKHFLYIDLGHSALLANPTTWLLPALAAATTFVQSKMVTPAVPAEGADPQAAQMAQMTQSMALLAPAMILFFAFQPRVAQGLVLYWIVSNLFSIFQQYTVNGWGQLPILGKKPPAGGTGNADARPGSSATRGKKGARSPKVLAGAAAGSGRRGRRR